MSFVHQHTSSDVTEYAPPYTGFPVAVIANSLEGPAGVAIDQSGNLFVSNTSNNSVTEYAPPYTGSPVFTMSNGVSEPDAVAINAARDLFVSNGEINLPFGEVMEYKPPYTGSPVNTLTGGFCECVAFQMAFDLNGDLFVPWSGPGAVQEFAPPYNGAPITLNIPDEIGPYPIAVAYLPSGNPLLMGDVFVLDQGNSTIYEFSPPYAGPPFAQIPNVQSSGIAFGP